MLLIVPPKQATVYFLSDLTTASIPFFAIDTYLYSTASFVLISHPHTTPQTSTNFPIAFNYPHSSSTTTALFGFCMTSLTYASTSFFI
ncbi:hypothetical protein BB558_000832 [Smittium angustum]|uniref:Uncharacterized protein n=1 Tax=Smittium angustum TaxID=133377 RepID=A0A2U1JD33_SMIAN|nr:hypothetical protein BB558_007328 [Smittium angustum]PWA03000.1 hypothetical protein BB558_000832 [Smittium angustum]